MEDAIALLT